MSEKVLFTSKWIEVRDKDGFVYSHSPWGNGKGVAVLGYKNSINGVEYLGRYELCPAHGDSLELCSLTGGMDKEGELPVMCAMRELEEESGYVVKDVRRFIDLGNVFISKGSDTEVFYFAVEIKDDTQKVEPEGDGTELEEKAYCKWISKKEAMESKDPTLHSMIMRLEAQKG